MSNTTSPWPPALPSVTANPNELSEALKQGMIPISIFAICSMLSTSALLLWITWRLIFKADYQAFVGYNQYVILIYNLLLADLQQALAFIITLHWLDIGQIESPSRTCFAQGFLLNMGDVSSGFFVFSIALHTWYSVVLGRKVAYGYFTAGILLVWTFAFFLTVIGPATKGPQFYIKTNAWVRGFFRMISKSVLTWLLVLGQPKVRFMAPLGPLYLGLRCRIRHHYDLRACVLPSAKAVEHNSFCCRV
jgi:hypothetical protein